MKKIVYILLTALMLLTALNSCSKQSTQEPSVTDSELKTFTLEELAQFDGQDGRDAYVAVDGVIYDVTNASPWKGGKHNGFTAGKDLTEEIKNISPHGVSKLKNVPVVGKLEE